MFDETAINHALGRALRRRCRAWEREGVLQVQPLGALQSRGRPDILITEPGRDPVIIETEVSPAPDVEKDCKARLGTKTIGGDMVRTCIAVRLPGSLREAAGEESLSDELERATLQMAFWSLAGTRKRRWPDRGWIDGSVSTLAFAAHQSATAQHRIRQASDALAVSVSAAGTKLEELKTLGYERILQRISEVLCQAPTEQTWRMAGLILANALVFHDLLAGRGNFSHVPSVSTLQLRHGGSLQKVDVVNAWREIYKVNYWPIFHLAIQILCLIPDHSANRILNDLNAALGTANLRTLLPSHDVLSQTFQRLIVDRKKLASFYTLPETAALLSALCLRPEAGLSGLRWGDVEGLKSVVVADYACGTGTLLAAAYRRMCWLHELEGGHPDQLHSVWMAQSLFGVDVLPAAAHLTATMLSAIYPAVHYPQSQVYIAPFGPSRPDAAPALGSLDLLDRQYPLTNLVSLATQITATGAAHTELGRNAPRVDLCIMNPPYTRNTNHEGARASDLLPAFAAFGIPRDAQTAMGNRLKELTRDSFAHGNAGVGSAFLLLADRMIKDGGTLAMVLPLTFLSGSSWSKARAKIAKHYTELIVVTISGRAARQYGFSADTKLAECLLVAKKRPQQARPSAVMVSLDYRPTNELAATFVAELIMKLVREGRVPSLGGAPNGGTELRLGDDRIGSLLEVPLEWGPGWAGGRVVDYSLIQTAYHLTERKRAWLPGVRQDDAVPVPITTMRDVGKLGPLHRDINGKQRDKQGHPRGPFDVVDISPLEVPTYPILWRHRAEGETTLEFGPDAKGVLRPNHNPAKLSTISASATHLHLNLDWQFNSQPLQAQWTPRPTIGGRAWPSILVHPHEKGRPCDETKERLQAIALLLWMNSTVGILVRWVWSNRQQNGRGVITRQVVPKLPVLDVRLLESRQLERCEELFQRIAKEPMMPVHMLPQDRTRAELDRGLLNGVLGWPNEWFDPDGPIELVRRKLAAEPSIHGYKRAGRRSRGPH